MMKLNRRFDRRQRKLARDALDSLSFQERFIIDTVTNRRPRLSVSCNKYIRHRDDCVLVQYVKSVSPKGRSIKTDYDRSFVLAETVRRLQSRGWLRFIEGPLAENETNPFGHMVLTDAAAAVIETATGRSL